MINESKKSYDQINFIYLNRDQRDQSIDKLKYQIGH